MRIVIVPPIARFEEGLGLVVSADVPDWLQSRTRGWSRDSSVLWGGGRGLICKLRVTDQEMDGLVKADPRLIDRGEVASVDDDDDFEAGLLAQPTAWNDWANAWAERVRLTKAILADGANATIRDKNDLLRVADEMTSHSNDCDEFHATVRQEYVDASKSLITQIEREELDRPGRDIKALTASASDGFSGTNGTNLHTATSGRTMDAAGGGSANSWGVGGDGGGGGAKVNAGYVETNGGDNGNATIFHDVTTPDVATQRVSFSVVDSNAGGISRYVDPLNFYIIFVTSTPKPQSYSRLSGTYNQLGSDGPTTGVGHVLAEDCASASISGLDNGGVVCGPTNNTDRSTGGWGMRLYPGSGSNRAEDFLAEILASATGGARLVNGGLLRGGRLLRSRLAGGLR